MNIDLNHPNLPHVTTDKKNKMQRHFVQMWMRKQSNMCLFLDSLGCKQSIHNKGHLSPVSALRMGGPGGVHCPISGSEKRILFQAADPPKKGCVCACALPYIFICVTRVNACFLTPLLYIQWSYPLFNNVSFTLNIWNVLSWIGRSTTSTNHHNQPLVHSVLASLPSNVL